MPGCRGTLGGSATIVDDDGGSGVGAKADPGGSPQNEGFVVVAAAAAADGPPNWAASAAGPCDEAARRAAKSGPTGSQEISATPGPAGTEVATAAEVVIAIAPAAPPSSSEGRRSGRAEGAARSANDEPEVPLPGATEEGARSIFVGELAARWGWPRPRTEDDPI